MKIKSMPSHKQALIQVHAAVFLFGLSGLFGKFLALPAPMIVLGRTGFASLSLGVWLASQQKPFRPSHRLDLLGFVLLGGLLAFHWVSFFLSIQLSTVAIGLLTFSSFPVFVTLLEPICFRTRWRWQDATVAALVVVGVTLVIQEYRLEAEMTVGAIWGLLSGLSFALLQLLNKGYRQRYSAIAIAFYQDLFAFISLLWVTPWVAVALSVRDWGLLIGLGVLCTAVAHTLFIESLAVLHTQTASIISALEPVYGIGLAVLLLREIPNLQTLLGGLLIISTTILVSQQSQG
jgi:drug/metabolite transporter (DMT)-like permease